MTQIGILQDKAEAIVAQLEQAGLLKLKDRDKSLAHVLGSLRHGGNWRLYENEGRIEVAPKIKYQPKRATGRK